MLGSSKKRTKHTKDNILSEFRFFGRIWDFIICFRNLLTFSKIAEIFCAVLTAQTCPKTTKVQNSFEFLQYLGYIDQSEAQEREHGIQQPIPPILHFQYHEVFAFILEIGRYQHQQVYTITLGTKMFGVGDFWLETKVIIKISKIPC